MTHQDIISRVARGAELATKRHAEHTLRAVLETLAERVDPETVEKLTQKLPVETAVYLHDIPEAPAHAARDVDAFLDRVGGRLALTRPDAVRVSQVVMSVISLAAGEESVREIQEQLPASWRTIFEPRRLHVPPPPPVPA